MTITIKPQLDDNFNYAGTFFADLAVTMIEPSAERDYFARILDDAFRTPSYSPQPLRLPPTVMKTFWFSDRRYNPVHRSWSLDELIDRLDLAASFGPVQEKQVEQHAAFTIERERPEDRIVKVSQRGVCLNEWAFEPLYKQGQFASLEPAIEALKSIQAYIRSQEIS